MSDKTMKSYFTAVTSGHIQCKLCDIKLVSKLFNLKRNVQRIHPEENITKSKITSFLKVF